MKANPTPARDESVALPGVAPAIVAKYGAMQVATWFSPHAHLGDALVRYWRPNGDVTSWLSASLHNRYVAKGWTAVEVYEAPAVPVVAPAVVAAELVEHAQHDRLARWTKSDAAMLSSTRNAKNLIQKGWAFARLATAREIYLDGLQERVPSAEEAAYAATLAHGE